MLEIFSLWVENLFLGVELRDGGDLEGLERKSSTYN